MNDAAKAARNCLREAAGKGVEEYVSAYTRSLPVIKTLTAEAGEIKCESVSEALNAIKVSLLYNSTSVIDLVSESSSLHVTWLTGEGIKNLGGSGQIEVNIPAGTPVAVAKDINDGRVGFGFVASKNDELEQLLSDSMKLISQGRLLPQPSRVLFHSDGVKNENGGHSWNALSTEADSGLDVWNLSKKDMKERTVTEDSFNNNYANYLAQDRSGDLIMPYISGVSLREYADILDDEADILTEFRVSLDGLVAEQRASHAKVGQFRMDVVEPRIAKINRAFTRISNMRRLRAGGAAVATAALTLVAYGAGGVGGAIAAAAGGGGILSFVNELSEANDKIAALKDDPIYLLWKLRSLQGR